MLLQRYSTNTKRYPIPKKFLETLNFSQPKLPQKGGFVYLFLGIKTEKTDSGFPKTFGAYIFVFVKYLCNCSTKMRPQKFYFEFSYCKVLELVEYLTPFRTDYLIQIFVMNRGMRNSFDRVATTWKNPECFCCPGKFFNFV